MISCMHAPRARGRIHSHSGRMHPRGACRRAPWRSTWYTIGADPTARGSAHGALELGHCSMLQSLHARARGARIRASAGPRTRGACPHRRACTHARMLNCMQLQAHGARARALALIAMTMIRYKLQSIAIAQMHCACSCMCRAPWHAEAELNFVTVARRRQCAALRAGATPPAPAASPPAAVITARRDDGRRNQPSRRRPQTSTSVPFNQPSRLSLQSPASHGPAEGPS